MSRWVVSSIGRPYAGIKSYDGRLLGVLSIPYFYARPELDRQIIEVIASALSIFTALFLFFLVLSYFASHVLTKPLRLLTQKIRKTNLERPNDPLHWQSDDEIGLLIREYNRMLVKLEESKQALAQTEKTIGLAGNGQASGPRNQESAHPR